MIWMQCRNGEFICSLRDNLNTGAVIRSWHRCNLWEKLLASVRVEIFFLSCFFPSLLKSENRIDSDEWQPFHTISRAYLHIYGNLKSILVVREVMNSLKMTPDTLPPQSNLRAIWKRERQLRAPVFWQFSKQVADVQVQTWFRFKRSVSVVWFYSRRKENEMRAKRWTLKKDLRLEVSNFN